MVNLNLNLDPMEKIIFNSPFTVLHRLWTRHILEKRTFLVGKVRVGHLAMYVIHQLLKDGPMDYRRFSCLLFLMQERMLEKDGINLGIPFVWGDASMFDPATDRVFVIG